jgi:AmmeMemoRadiSam system protein A
MAEASAFHDSRFPPLGLDEFPTIEIDISIIGPISRCFDPSQIILGEHGLIMRRGNKQGLLLPQVPIEWEWDSETFLSQTCVKAGLPRDAWQDPDTEIFWFHALVF